MLRRIIKIVAVLAVVIPLAVAAAIPFIGDEALYGALVATPVAGDHADAILNRKQRIEAALGRYGDDITLAWRSLAGDDRGASRGAMEDAGERRSTRRVVMTLPAPQPPGVGADQGWAVRTEPKGDAPPAPPAVSPPSPIAKRPAVLRPAPLDLAPPPPPLVSEPAPKPAAEAPPMPAPLSVPKPPAPKLPATEPMAKVKLPAAREAKAPTPAPALISRKPALPDETADQDHKRGMLFYKGIGVEKDFKKAVLWFRRAAEKGHAVAQYNLGIMTYLGQGVDQDYRQAAEWFRRAGEQDHAAAQYNLGFLYYEGKGVERDNLQAYMWIDRAASLGDDKAVKARDTLQKALPKDIFQR